MFGGVHLVAGAARAAQFAPVHVEVMQISAAVAELREFFGLRLRKRLFLVAAEAKRIVLRIVSRNKTPPGTHSSAAGSFRRHASVAGTAILGGNRTMLIRIVCEQLFHVRQLLAVMVQQRRPCRGIAGKAAWAVGPAGARHWRHAGYGS